MFRRAKLQLDGVPAEVFDLVVAMGRPLVGELGLTCPVPRVSPSPASPDPSPSAHVPLSATGRPAWDAVRALGPAAAGPRAG